MEDIACPRCKTTKYRNPSLKLLVNVCGHALCESCVELLFVKGSNACTVCNTPLRRGNFRLQIFEDASVEKEVDIRRKVLRDFNKKEDDFPTLKEYNDYLEEIEVIIHNLVNDIDIDGTKRKMEQYKKENKTTIMRNKGKLTKEEEELEEMLLREQEEEESRKQQWLEEEKEEEIFKKKSKESLIDNLMFSDMPADQIIASHTITFIRRRDATKMPTAKPSVTKFSSGVKIGQKDNFLPLPKMVENELFAYEEPKLELCGPEAPCFEELDIEKYTNHVRAAGDQEKAGGYVEHFACYRAIQDALCGLYYTKN